ncbi:hypothetical protein [Methyloterricola oryzae]|uniref:hypothetical protein n=1 Tax=Methyloterricola oryzae TaxID=1495050 RepID=UPI001300E093|nr:hypothetical protein [Methyloterricola oryzae]
MFQLSGSFQAFWSGKTLGPRQVVAAAALLMPILTASSRMVKSNPVRENIVRVGIAVLERGRG